MNKTNDELYEDAVKAITALFSDQSVSKEQAAQNLQALIGEIQVMLEAL